MSRARFASSSLRFGEVGTGRRGRVAVRPPVGLMQADPGAPPRLAAAEEGGQQLPPAGARSRVPPPRLHPATIAEDVASLQPLQARAVKIQQPFAGPLPSPRDEDTRMYRADVEQQTVALREALDEDLRRREAQGEDRILFLSGTSTATRASSTAAYRCAASCASLGYSGLGAAFESAIDAASSVLWAALHASCCPTSDVGRRTTVVTGERIRAVEAVRAIQASLQRVQGAGVCFHCRTVLPVAPEGVCGNTVRLFP